MRKHIYLDPGGAAAQVTVSGDMKDDLPVKVAANRVEKAPTYFTLGPSCKASEAWETDGKVSLSISSAAESGSGGQPEFMLEQW